MSKFELVFYLKQHTPIIHFQHNQTGATLRATELKPKLDKFIINKLGKDKIRDDWYIDKEKKDKKGKGALNYKVMIEGKDEENNFFIILPSTVKKEKVQKFIKNYENFTGNNITHLFLTPYFAMFDTFNKLLKNNLNQKEKIKLYNKLILGVQAPKNIKVKIFCYDNSLKQIINNNFSEFLCLENFGARQNKGFGCFYEESTTKEDLEKILKVKYKDVFKKDVKKNNIGVIFKEIHSIYQEIKNNPLKETSALKEYFEEKKGIIWEKELIKDHLILGNPIDNIQDISRYKFVRALLGLADNYSYPNKNINIKISDAKRKEDENYIERFKSPIFFKVFEGSIYIVSNTVDEKILDNEFVFKNKEKNLLLKTPKDIDISAILSKVRGIRKI